MSHNANTMPSNQARPPLKRIGGIAIIVVIVLVAWGLYSRHRQSQDLVKWTDAQLVPTVQLAPAGEVAGHSMTLPGRLDAWNSAPIRARVSGYLKDWYKDIGAPVKAGDVLATIDTPDLDQQYAQAKADLARYRADATLADISARRWKNLRQSDSVSQQELDEKNGQAEAAKANVLSAQANVDRLAALESYKQIIAPFDGTVTARNTDIGDLITANVSTGPELFSVADTSKLRLYVRVPQNYATMLHVGMKVQLAVPEHPGKQFEATMVGTSGAVNSLSGAVLAQFIATNADRQLLPGDYADVRFSMSPDAKIVSVPASALLFRAAGAQVATVGPDDKVTLHKVHIALDLGPTLEIDQGLSPQDRIIINPTDSLEQGDKVKIDADQQAGGGHAHADA
ncbi:efflux RND transporter periplasmic adaptor subunit [Frateuria aurantia]